MTNSSNEQEGTNGRFPSAEEIGGLLAEARRAIGYSIDELAVTTGLVSDEIAAIENGVDSDPARLRRVAAALKVSVPTPPSS